MTAATVTFENKTDSQTPPGTTNTTRASDYNQLKAAANDHASRLDQIQSQSPGAPNFSVGAQSGDVINVIIGLRDSDNQPVTDERVVQIYISDDAAGAGLTATAADSISVGTDGTILIEQETGKWVHVESEANGDIDLDIEFTSSGTRYVVLITSRGKKYVSSSMVYVSAV